MFLDQHGFRITLRELLVVILVVSVCLGAIYVPGPFTLLLFSIGFYIVLVANTIVACLSTRRRATATAFAATAFLHLFLTKLYSSLFPFKEWLVGLVQPRPLFAESPLDSARGLDMAVMTVALVLGLIAAWIARGIKSSGERQSD